MIWIFTLPLENAVKHIENVFIYVRNFRGDIK